SDVRRHALLRLVAQSPRQRTRTRGEPSGDRVGRARRALVVLFSRRRLLRVLTAAGAAAGATKPRRRTQSVFVQEFLVYLRPFVLSRFRGSSGGTPAVES